MIRCCHIRYIVSHTIVSLVVHVFVSFDLISSCYRTIFKKFMSIGFFTSLSFMCKICIIIPKITVLNYTIFSCLKNHPHFIFWFFTDTIYILSLYISQSFERFCFQSKASQMVILLYFPSISKSALLFKNSHLLILSV